MKNVNVESLVRPHLAKIETYEALDSVEALAEQAGIPAGEIIRLNANENPYGPSPTVAGALAKVSVHVYPDPVQRDVRKALSKYTGIDPGSIVAGAGSDELIELLLRLFVSPGETIVVCDPTFGMYAFLVRVAGGSVTSIARDELFEIDVEAVVNSVDSKTRMVFVDSPNNPAGNVASKKQVRELLDTGLVVVVDEAYHEFCDETAAGLLVDYENLVVLRSMSKWAGLAGLRVGYGMMSPKLVKHVIDIKQPYNVSGAAEAALLASLEDVDSLLANVALIVQERGRLFSLLKGIAGVEPWPSGGNFVLFEIADGRAGAVHAGLARRGIFVRRFSSPRLRDYLRVTVGTPEQTDAVIRAISDLL